MSENNTKNKEAEQRLASDYSDMLACPLCGKQADLIIKRPGGIPTGAYIECQCGIELHLAMPYSKDLTLFETVSKLIDSLINKWNRRAS